MYFFVLCSIKKLNKEIDEREKFLFKRKMKRIKKKERSKYTTKRLSKYE